MTLRQVVRREHDRRPFGSDMALALVTAAGTVPQIYHHAAHADRQLGTLMLFSALLVIPLGWRRRFPATMFAVAAAVAPAQWLAGVPAAADLTTTPPPAC